MTGKDGITAIGVDIGGTFIKAGVVSQTGRILKQVMVPSGVKGGVEAIESRIKEAVEELVSFDGNVCGVGVGVPGMIDVKRGIVVSSPNIPCWKNYRAVERLSSVVRFEVVVDNDANLAAVAEGWIGAGKSIKNFMMITLGTGIGCGIILNGELWHGDTGRAGEFGHVIVKGGGARCGCGSRGCIERYASASGLRRMAKQAGINVDVPELIKMLRRGDKKAARVFKKAGEMLGLAFAAWFNITDVRTVIVGGGALPAFKYMLPHIRHILRTGVYGLKWSDFRFTKAVLGKDAGTVGSARYAMIKFLNHGRNLKPSSKSNLT